MPVQRASLRMQRRSALFMEMYDGIGTGIARRGQGSIRLAITWIDIYIPRVNLVLLFIFSSVSAFVLWFGSP